VFALGTGSRTGRSQVCRNESYHTITPSMRPVGKQPCRIRSNFVGLGDSRSPPISDAARYDSSKTPQPKTPQPPPNESTFRKLYGSSPKPPAVATAPPTSSTSSAAAGTPPAAATTPLTCLNVTFRKSTARVHTCTSTTRAEANNKTDPSGLSSTSLPCSSI